MLFVSSSRIVFWPRVDAEAANGGEGVSGGLCSGAVWEVGVVVAGAVWNASASDSDVGSLAAEHQAAYTATGPSMPEQAPE